MTVCSRCPLRRRAFGTRLVQGTRGGPLRESRNHESPVPMSPAKLSIQNGCAEGMGSTLDEVQVQRIPGGAILPVTSYPVGHARFLPERMAHWTVCTAFALAAAIAVGLVIPCLVEPVVQMVPGGVEVEEQPWVRPVLFVWYALFVLLVVCPFAVFWTWSRLCRPRPVASDRQHWPKVSF